MTNPVSPQALAQPAVQQPHAQPAASQIPAAVQNNQGLPPTKLVPQEPNEFQKLQALLRSTTAQLMAHNQTVNELMKANMDLRAALHLSQNGHTALDAHIANALKTPAAAAPAATPVPSASVPATPADNGTAHADTVPA